MTRKEKLVVEYVAGNIFGEKPAKGRTSISYGEICDEIYMGYVDGYDAGYRNGFERCKRDAIAAVEKHGKMQIAGGSGFAIEGSRILTEAIESLGEVEVV